MKFEISRLMTPQGTFKLVGELIHSDDQQLIYHQAWFMGTDGWVELDISSPVTVSVLAQIKNTVIAHLLSD
ncbi:hypothetical protein [Shewanella waksmanii]|uniref:hypothetical protein n=1 Tax=Shewanella waksmanii TaxID=213783 RepID=UPI003735C52E